MTLAEIENTLPNGFHDALLNKLVVDFTSATAAFEFSVDVSDVDTREPVYRQVTVSVTKLRGIIFDAPNAPSEREPDPLFVGGFVPEKLPLFNGLSAHAQKIIYSFHRRLERIHTRNRR